MVWPQKTDTNTKTHKIQRHLENTLKETFDKTETTSETKRQANFETLSAFL